MICNKMRCGQVGIVVDDKLFKGGELSRVKYQVKHISKDVGLNIALG